ncbi:MAG TPA: sugar-binding protein [Pirellulales bacterium]|jgi:ribose transport system substrate-binding protein|nr:sugar-binding protein [Pirellulales bacterium]
MTALVGCTKTPSPSAAAPSAAAAKTVKLAFVTNNASDFWTYAHAGCDKAVADLGNVELDFQVPADGSAATQKRIVQDLLAKGVNGIAISPKDPANQTELLNEAAKQALLICHDSDAPASDRACYIGTDNTAAGRQAGGLIKEALPNGGKIMIFVGTLDAQNAKDRYTGIQEALKGSKVEIIEVRTDETDRVRAKSNVKDAILKYPELACLVGLWSYNGPAIYNAVKDADKVGKIKIVTFDEEDETLAGVKDGAIFATVVQQPYEFGYQAITLMAKVIGGDKSVVPDSKVIIVPTLAINKDTVDEFSARLKKLRGK